MPPEHQPDKTLFLITAAAGVILLLMTLYSVIRTPETFVSERESPPQTEIFTESPTEMQFTETVTETIAETDTTGVYSAGTYAVGKDIPAGTYLLLADNIANNEIGYGDFYAAVFANETDAENDTNAIWWNWWQNNCYLILKEGQWVNFSFATMYDTAYHDIPLSPEEKSGMFIVGKDIPAGTYQLIVTEEGYDPEYEIYSIYNSLGGVVRETWIYNSPHDSITVEDGEYLFTRFCKLKKIS